MMSGTLIAYLNDVTDIACVGVLKRLLGALKNALVHIAFTCVQIVN